MNSTSSHIREDAALVRTGGFRAGGDHDDVQTVLVAEADAYPFLTAPVFRQRGCTPGED